MIVHQIFSLKKMILQKVLILIALIIIIKIHIYTSTNILVISIWIIYQNIIIK
jgi:hypothetical protein